ncbi:hypothetical protein GCM10023196_058440 [Actinoallomurus vinaceus]|uniref:Secreted protein n=1 Tax=Actinoallomurus vinaceus TaxID=1080074 RepID=A0ABP8UGS5_9ACTN
MKSAARGKPQLAAMAWIETVRPVLSWTFFIAPTLRNRAASTACMFRKDVRAGEGPAEHEGHGHRTVTVEVLSAYAGIAEERR